MTDVSTMDIEYVDYSDESMLPDIQRLVSTDLSEPYSIYTYRYFLYNWPYLCTCVYAKDATAPAGRTMIATIVSKLEDIKGVKQGYIAMLAVDKSFRKRGIAMQLVSMNIQRMVEQGCEEVMLEAEASNRGALNLYTKFGFVKEELMAKYYLNSGDAFRLKLWIDQQPGNISDEGKAMSSQGNSSDSNQHA